MSGPVALDAEFLKTIPLPFPEGETDKDGRGRVMAIAGSVSVPGAVVLTGEAALRAGAGKLQLAAPASLGPALGIAAPEARIFRLEETDDGECAAGAADALRETVCRCDAVVIGPGMIDASAAGALTAGLLRTVEGPGFVIDAAAMTGLWDQADLVRRHAGRVVITPHAGEMAALTGSTKQAVQADPLAAARKVAAQLQIVVAMKGTSTLVVSPDGAAWLYSGGSVGLATSGSGDVLAGVVAGLMARGAPPVHATLWAVFLHGEAGARLAARRGPLGFLAREIAAEVPPIMAELSPHPPTP